MEACSISSVVLSFFKIERPFSRLFTIPAISASAVLNRSKYRRMGLNTFPRTPVLVKSSPDGSRSRILTDKSSRPFATSPDSPPARLNSPMRFWRMLFLDCDCFIISAPKVSTTWTNSRRCARESRSTAMIWSALSFTALVITVFSSAVGASSAATSFLITSVFGKSNVNPLISVLLLHICIKQGL